MEESRHPEEAWAMQDCDDLCAPTPARVPGMPQQNRRTGRGFRLFVSGSLTFAAAYVGYQRIGTSANADTVTFVENLAGGFAAVGMTDDQPGFLVLSALDRKAATVETEMSINRIAGTHTFVYLTTPHERRTIRLRGPRVLLIARQRAIISLSVDWTPDDFKKLLEWMDCDNAGRTAKRCGEPFGDLHDALSATPALRVPDAIQEFLAQLSGGRDHHHHESEPASG